MTTSSIHRRNFLKVCGATAAAGVPLLLSPTPALAHNSIRFWMHGFNEQRFGEETLLKRAMNVVADRFQDMDVLRNAYEITGGGRGYYLGGGVWEKSNLDAHPTYTYRHLLWFQVTSLMLPNDGDDTEPAFPNVHLHAFHEKSSTWAKAPIGTVAIRYQRYQRGGTIRQSGSFKVYINRYKLASGGYGSDPVTWAHVIAHEMLHNLGHMHEKGEYDAGRQMNAFDKSLYCDGNYRRGRFTPGYGCHCSLPI